MRNQETQEHTSTLSTARFVFGSLRKYIVSSFFLGFLARCCGFDIVPDIVFFLFEKFRLRMRKSLAVSINLTFRLGSWMMGTPNHSDFERWPMVAVSKIAANLFILSPSFEVVVTAPLPFVNLSNAEQINRKCGSWANRRVTIALRIVSSSPKG